MMLTSLANIRRPVCQQGYSLLELLLVVTIVGVLGAIAVPVFSNMRQGLQYRQAAQATVSALRFAKTRAVMTNRQHQVQFDSVSRSVEVRRGNLAASSTSFPVVARPADTFPNNVFISGATSVTFNPTGSATQATLLIKDSADQAKYRINVANSGRIWLSK